MTSRKVIDASWTVEEVKIIGHRDTLKAAFEKLNESLDTSDLRQSDPDEQRRTRKLRKRRIIYDSSDTNDVDELMDGGTQPSCHTKASMLPPAPKPQSIAPCSSAVVLTCPIESSPSTPPVTRGLFELSTSSSIALQSESACSSPDIMSLGPIPAQHRMPTPCQTPRAGRSQQETPCSDTGTTNMNDYLCILNLFN
ncbi:uncharacterized protein LOC142566077 [Dermacentor variabilis]|uniref:uncharacterized protein LOC142566077 n=1 Tax=Dermacentor variabilis TaxID=34621 RepID=UPI003F5BCEC3